MAASAIEGAAATALRSVLNRVHQATERCGRPADQVRVVAVSKTKPISVIKQVYDAGHRCFGENYAQEIVEKAPQLPADIKWHFIGHLQSNKVKTLLGNSQPSWNLHSFRFSIGAPSRKLDNSFSAFKEFCTFESQSQSQSSESKIPPELLKKQTSLKPDRTVGQHQDLVTNITNFENEDKGLIVLAGDVFDVPIRKDIIHRVVRWQLAKRQQGTHSTKRISEVSGTGKKPYNQKGTGRARHGTLRGPQFRGGAIVHGPKPRSHAFKLNKKVRRLGLKIALSARAAEGKLLVFENPELPNHKTKNIVSYVSQMENTKKVLLVDGGPINDNLYLATGNLHYVNVLPSIGLNVYSILQHDTLVMTRDAIDKIVTRMHTPINR